MANDRHNHNVWVLVRLSPEDILTIRTALRVLIQIHTREEGYGDVRQALADLRSEEDLAELEVGDQLHALARACRDVGLDVESGPGVPCSGGEAASRASAQPLRLRATLPIVGFACGGGGALTIERLLERQPGVVRAYVNPATEMAYVEYDGSQTDVAALGKVIESAGHKAVLPTAGAREG
jgi:copper chaperone CopZ